MINLYLCFMAGIVVTLGVVLIGIITVDVFMTYYKSHVKRVKK